MTARTKLEGKRHDTTERKVYKVNSQHLSNDPFFKIFFFFKYVLSLPNNENTLFQADQDRVVMRCVMCYVIERTLWT